MRVFVTGASGLIGSAVVPELIAAGHQVIGLARSDRSAQAITAAGAEVIRGDLQDAESLRAGATQADGVIHLAFGHDFTKFEASIAEEAFVVETVGTALKGSGKAFVMASGTPAVPGRVSTENDPAPTDGPAGGRGRNAQTLLDLAGAGIRSAVVRLPRSVHAQGQGYGFASVLIDAARRTGVSGYVGDGSQRWPTVHRLDAARLFRLILENAEPGTVAHAVADEGDSMLSIAQTIGRQLNVPAKAVPAQVYGFLGRIFGIDQPSSSTITRERFGWQPTHPSLHEELRAGNYPA
jgi:nucleoside-diphosphate-sugar epimerase